MSRHEESIGRMPNPSQYFLEWDSEKNCFCYYSKEEQERKPFPLPFKFLALKFMNTITGFNEDTKQGIYANEVSDTRIEHFRVSYRDGSSLASGLYSDIKDEVNHFGGRFTRSIYAITPKGKIANIRIKGGQMLNFGVIEKFGNRWRDEWIEVKSYETKINPHSEREYTIPVFSFGGGLQQSDAVKADKAYELIKAYFNSKSSGPNNNSRPAQQKPAAQSAPIGSSTIFTPNDDDDLPF